MAAGWSKLHKDILLLIFQWLPIPDLLRAAAACTSWYSASGELHRFGFLHRCQLPWLFLYGRDHRMAVDDEANTAAATFCSVLEKKFYTIPVADLSIIGCKCVGSSHGWLIVADDFSELHLFNPITGAKIDDLPPVSSFDHMTGLRNELRYVVYYKAILSSNPHDGNYTILLIHGPKRKLSFARAGDERWRTISSECNYHNIISHDNKLYAMCCCGDVEVWDLDEGSPKAASVVIRAAPPGRREIGNGYYRYLVPHPTCDPFQVWREPSGDGRFRFRVYRIDHRRSDRVMVEVESLGDYALLVGINQSMCLSCKDFPEMKPNCIYFADDEQDLAIRAIGIYSVEDESIHSVSELDSRLWKRATWFTASLV